MIQKTQARRKARGLAFPVEDERARHNEQGSPLRKPALFERLQEGKRSDGLARTHVIRKAAAEVVLAQEIEPVESCFLIRSQFAVEMFGELLLFDAVEVTQMFAAAFE